MFGTILGILALIATISVVVYFAEMASDFMKHENIMEPDFEERTFSIG